MEGVGQFPGEGSGGGGGQFLGEGCGGGGSVPG